MIVESAILPILPGKEAAFEAALRSALPLIQASKGFRKIEVRPCVENKSHYLLLVWWDTLSASFIVNTLISFTLLRHTFFIPQVFPQMHRKE